MREVTRLRWSEVDPARQRFDVEEARAIAARVVAEAADHPPVDRPALSVWIDRGFVNAFGAWAAGWKWTPADGGPSRAWSPSGASLFVKGEKGDPGPSIARAVEALVTWRTFLEGLAALFRDIERDAVDMGPAEAVTFAAARILPVVVERTGAEDAWYATMIIALDWQLESTGFDAEAVRPIVDQVIGGRFESWIEPSEAVARAAFEQLGKDVLSPATVRVDATRAWLHLRKHAFVDLAVPHEPLRAVQEDGHLAFVYGPEHDRDATRAERMAAALEACRASARRNEPLTFATLSAWQALVLGVPSVGFRTADAFAKRGRERYVYSPYVARRFEECLAECNDATVDPCVRAARVYLDVCFIHPFDDGNARAARLALDHVLTRSGMALHLAEPLFVAARAADDVKGTAAFVALLRSLVGTAPREG